MFYKAFNVFFPSSYIDILEQEFSSKKEIFYHFINLYVSQKNCKMIISARPGFMWFATKEKSVTFNSFKI